MSEDRFIADLHNAVQAHAQIQRAWRWAKGMLINKSGSLILEIVIAKSREQERLYHACFRDLARDCLLGGEKHDEEAWKRALLQAFYDGTKDDPEFVDDWRTRAPRMVPTLDGSGALITGVESKRFTKRMARGFIEFVHAEGNHRGVKWSKTSLGRETEMA